MTSKVSLRNVQESDLPIFFEQQLDPEATRMADFPARDQESFMTHWSKIMADKTGTLQTILYDGRVAGNMVRWEQDNEHYIGYWLGREYWGKGIASAALSQFLDLVTVRPLIAYVVRHNIASMRVLQKCGFTISSEDRFADANGESGEEYVFTLGAAEQSHTG